MSDDLVKRAEQMMLEMQQLGYEVWPSIIRDLLADRRETALAMPEVKALVEALVETNNKLYCMAFKEYDGVWDSEDLSNLTKKGDDALAAIDLNAIGKTQKPAPTE